MFKVGDKVYPLKKSLFGNLGESVAWRRAREKGQNFLYITATDYKYSSWLDETCFLLNEEINDFPSGDFFLKEDFVLSKAINKGKE